MQIINVIIADDHEPSRKQLKKLIKMQPEFRIVDAVKDGEELVRKVMVFKPDLVLVDAPMPLDGGVQAVRQCLTLKPDLQVIFVTDSDDYAVAAFDLNAVDYVKKPVETYRLYLALERAKHRLNCERMSIREHKRLSIQYKHAYYYIALEEIIFIERVDRKSVIHTREQQYQTYEPLEKLLQSLGPAFYQSHRSYIVHIPHICRITNHGKSFLVHFRNYDHAAFVSKQKLNQLLRMLEKMSNRSG